MPTRPTRISQAKTVAALGASAVDILVWEPGLKQNAAIASVRALGLIGGPAALEALKTYHQEHRAKVVAELVGVSSAFDPDTFSTGILTKLPIQALDLTAIPSLKSLAVLSEMHQLTSLTVSGHKELRDISALSRLTNLQSLNLKGCKNIQDLTPLAGLSRLTSLNLSFCTHIADLKPLKGLTNLTELSLAEVEHIADLRPLAALKKVRRLSLKTQRVGLPSKRSARIATLSGLEGMTRLEELDVSGLEQLDNIDALTDHPTLRMLSIANVPSLKAFDVLGTLQRLESLTISFNTITDLSVVSALPNLITLRAESCRQLKDLSPLSSLSTLDALYLAYCSSITDLSPLAALNQLRRLSLCGCTQVEDLSPLSALESLQTPDVFDARARWA